MELRQVERLRPFKAALDEHFQYRLDAPGVVEAAERDEDRPREALQVAAEHPGAASRTEVSVQALARLGDVVKRLGLSAKQCEIIAIQVRSAKPDALSGSPAKRNGSPSLSIAADEALNADLRLDARMASAATAERKQPRPAISPHLIGSRS
jgi:hypothetical protein